MYTFFFFSFLNNKDPPTDTHIKQYIHTSSLLLFIFTPLFLLSLPAVVCLPSMACSMACTTIPDPFLHQAASASMVVIKKEKTTTPASWHKQQALQRKGNWTAEEEIYARELIRAFQDGWVEIPDGTFLRAFLSERLNCSPMRISKKFMIGKQCFSPCVRRGTEQEIRTKLQHQTKVLNRLKTEFKKSIGEVPTRSRASADSVSRKRPRTMEKFVPPNIQMCPSPGSVPLMFAHQKNYVNGTYGGCWPTLLPIMNLSPAHSTNPFLFQQPMAVPQPAFMDFFSQKAKDSTVIKDFKYDVSCDNKFERTIETPMVSTTPDLEVVKVEKMYLEVQDCNAGTTAAFESACAGLAESSLEMPAAHMAFLESVQHLEGDTEYNPSSPPEEDDYDFEDDNDGGDILGGLDGDSRQNDLLSAFDELLTESETTEGGGDHGCAVMDLEIGSPPSSPRFTDDENQVLVSVKGDSCAKATCSQCATVLFASAKFCFECGAKI